MKNIIVTLLFLIVAAPMLHASKVAGEMFLNAHKSRIAAEDAERSNHLTTATLQYQTAYETLLLLKAQHPAWQKEIVAYRLDKIRKSWISLQVRLEKGPVIEAKKPTSVPLQRIPSPTSKEPTPEKWRSFDFNGEKYYNVPLGASDLTTASR